MKILSVVGLCEILSRMGSELFFQQALRHLENDFSNWRHFKKSPRHATLYPFGVIELMPCSDDEFYTFKYVNGHPRNTKQGKMCVVAFGMLSDVQTGYPLLLSEMTLLTAIRSAAVTALGAKYLARSNSCHLAIIGTGAQSEFQCLMLRQQFPLTKLSYYDLDKQAMNKFENNMRGKNIFLQACDSIEATVGDADIIVTATAAKSGNDLIRPEWLKKGVHIHAMGGDCPGKTELGRAVLKNCKIVVEYAEQSLDEGEMQQMQTTDLYGELWELVSGALPGRENDQETTLLDAVGFALEDFSILKLVHELTEHPDYSDICVNSAIIPDLSDPKNLYSLISQIEANHRKRL
ncbi:MAG: ornithine cyclodeaminase [Cellvibrionales bacterium]|nr:MAG: ornithine cyclodeaminase [Cellvibrionales bacterium]